jgi:hypothetical protein
LAGTRSAGWSIAVASVRSPERDLGDRALDTLADEAIPVYGAGAARLLRDAAMEALRHPGRTLRTLGCCMKDALRAKDVPIARSPKVLVQCLASLALARRVRPMDVAHIHAHMAHVPTTIAMYTAIDHAGGIIHLDPVPVLGPPFIEQVRNRILFGIFVAFLVLYPVLATRPSDAMITA